MRRRATIAALAAGAAILAAPALADFAVFGSAEGVDAANPLIDSAPWQEQVGVDAAGNSYIRLTRTVVQGEDEDLQAAVTARCLASGWIPVVQEGLTDRLSHVRDLAVAPNGAAVLVWTDEHSSSNFDAYASYRAAGGDWGAPQKLVSGNVREFDVGIDDAGNAAVAYMEGGGISRDAYAGYRPAGAAGTWETPVELPGTLNTAVLAMSAAGEVAVVGQVGSSGSGALRAVVRPAGQPWPAGFETVPTPSAPQLNTDGPNAVAYDSAGRLIVLDGENAFDIEATIRSGGTWGGTQTLFDGQTAGAAVVDLARHPQGAVALWRHSGDLYASRLSGGTWEAQPAKFDLTEGFSTGTVAADAAGNIVVAATLTRPAGREIWAATADGIGSAWSGPARLSPEAVQNGRYYENPAAGGGGHLVVAWTVREPGNRQSTQAVASGPAPVCSTGTATPTPTPTSTPPPPPPPIAATPTPAPTAPKPKPAARPKISAFVKLPKCARARKLKVSVKAPAGQDVTRVELRVNGKRAALRRAPRVAGSLTLRKLPRRFRLEAIVSFASGPPVRATRTVKACR